MSKYKVQAFTLMELTIAMLLTVLVIGLTYMAYTITAHSYSHFHRRSDTVASLVKVNELLIKDFSRADTVFKTDSGVVLKKDSLVIHYTIDSNMIVRSFGRIDTFTMPIQDLTISFEGQPVNFTAPVQEADRMDDLSFSVLFEKQKIPYHYHKDYSSASLIKRKAHAFN